MTRRAFNIAAAISLLLCAAAVALWARSFAGENILFGSHRGQLLLIGVDQVGPRALREARDDTTLEQFLDQLKSPPAEINGTAVPRPREAGAWGFVFLRGQVGAVPVPGGNNLWTPPFWVLGVPHWFVALLTMVVPLVWLWRRTRATRRRRANQCASCGYDLRASAGRCPECGAQAA